jgi:hypothetical protein
MSQRRGVGVLIAIARFKLVKGDFVDRPRLRREQREAKA